ncbi:MAG: bifunctional [glutamate--ammonia ligase]-adenylyl-L-tyrosine phosphorylase/[glutamate--ammonia-ligase] adenylyltransferase, partial [Nitrospinales bacterium]
NVKLGYGGLADIEFTVQVLQLMHGYRNPRLRRANTLEALSALVDCGILEHNQADRQRTHYLFLRNLECALRLLSQPFSNHLPRNETGKAALARLLGYEGETSAALADQLMKDYAETTDEVRTFYRKTLDTLLRTSL